MSTDVDVFLAHYGVKGMRWGVIRDNLSSKKGSASETKNSNSSPRPSSAYRTMMEAKYLKAGSSKEEAIAKADKAIRIQKIVAISGAVALSAALAYAAGNRVAKEFTGVKLAEGTTFQHISKSDSLDLTDKHLYTTFTRGDKFNYQGTFSAELGGNTHAITLKAIGKIKAPSNAQGQKILAESLGKSKVSQSEYRSFVSGYYKSGTSEAYVKFKDLMSKKGFNAIIDTTDQNFYAKAYKPLIVFDSSSNLLQKGARSISNKEMLGKMTTTRLSQALTSPENLGKIMAGTAAVSLIGTSSISANNKSIDAYLAKNPGSNLSRAEVALTLGLV